MLQQLQTYPLFWSFLHKASLSPTIVCYCCTEKIYFFFLSYMYRLYIRWTCVIDWRKKISLMKDRKQWKIDKNNRESTQMFIIARWLCIASTDKISDWSVLLSGNNENYKCAFSNQKTKNMISGEVGMRQQPNFQKI